MPRQHFLMLLPSGTLLGAGDWLSQLLFGGGVGLNGGPGKRQAKLASPKGGDGPCQSGSSSWKKSGWTEVSGWIPAPSCSLQQLGTCGTVWDSGAVGSSVRTVDAPVLLVPWVDGAERCPWLCCALLAAFLHSEAAQMLPWAQPEALVPLFLQFYPLHVSMSCTAALDAE